MENNVESRQKNVNMQETQQQEKREMQGKEVLYGGFWARLAAYFIDSFLVNIGIGALSVPLNSIDTLIYNDVISVVFNVFSVILYVAMGIGYFVYTTYKYQATPGKMAVGVRVLNEQGKKPTLGEVAMREILGKLVSNLTLGVGYLMVAFTSKKQGLHDMIGQTIVVCKDQKNGANKTVVVLVNVGVTLLYLLLFMLVFIIFIAAFVFSEGSGF